MRRMLQATAICVSLASSGCDRGAAVPARYRTLAVPDATLASAESRARGRALYLEHCALCHGERADGRGQRRAALSTAPADFTSRAWRAGTTPRRLYAVIHGGVRGTAMPAWRTLGDDEIWSLVAYLLAVSEQGA
jgi:mono/diheme cytochrome c family protein